MFLPDGLWSIRSEGVTGGACSGQVRRRPGRGVGKWLAYLKSSISRKISAGSWPHITSTFVDEGETIGIIGANGAGKTTFGSLVTGYLPPPVAGSSSSAKAS